LTYDTNTATEVWSRSDPYSDRWWGIYQTRYGAFFEVVHDPGDEETLFKPLLDDEAQRLLERHANHLVEQYFGPMPEYGSAERRLTVRMPIGLARRIEAVAAAQGLKVNRYIMRCLEKCVCADGAPPPVT
jgi:predicted DNA binding CopG/RHH family protein